MLRKTFECIIKLNTVVPQISRSEKDKLFLWHSPVNSVRIITLPKTRIDSAMLQ